MDRETALRLTYGIALKAKALQDNEAFVAAVERVSADLVEDWQGCEDMMERDALWHEQNALRRVLRQLDQFIEEGVAAEHDLAEMTDAA